MTEHQQKLYDYMVERLGLNNAQKENLEGTIWLMSDGECISDLEKLEEADEN